ncbi:MAG TPA: iron ABC transporter permease [Microbacteriaceae bacterium]|nr:iron ABC transporter permease [Microbacteriaceae bacterium]
MNRARRFAVTLTLSVTALALTSVASIVWGSRDVAISEVITALTDPSANGIAEAAVRERIPRTILGLLVGAALGLSGAVMQGITRNPLADPGLSGVNAGAAFAVVSALALAGTPAPGTLMWVALAGATLAAIVTAVLGSAGPGGASPLKLALAGAAVSAVCASLTNAVLLPRVDIMTEYRFWQIGSIGGADVHLFAAAAPFLIVGGVFALSSMRALNTLALGDELATGVGLHVPRARLVGATGAVMLAGTATALAGPIVFVGLVAPHVARLLLGSDYRWILPASVGFGAILVVAADVLGRILSRPSEIEVGITLCLIGAPIFIAIARRNRIAQL